MVPMLNNSHLSCTNLVGKDFWQLNVAVNSYAALSNLQEVSVTALNFLRNDIKLSQKHISGLLTSKQYPFEITKNRQSKGILQMFSRPPKP